MMNCQSDDLRQQQFSRAAWASTDLRGRVLQGLGGRFPECLLDGPQAAPGPFGLRR